MRRRVDLEHATVEWSPLARPSSWSAELCRTARPVLVLEASSPSPGSRPARALTHVVASPDGLVGADAVIRRHLELQVVLGMIAVLFGGPWRACRTGSSDRWSRRTPAMPTPRARSRLARRLGLRLAPGGEVDRLQPRGSRSGRGSGRAWRSACPSISLMSPVKSIGVAPLMYDPTAYESTGAPASLK